MITMTGRSRGLATACKRRRWACALQLVWCWYGHPRGSPGGVFSLGAADLIGVLSAVMNGEATLVAGACTGSLKNC